MNDEKYIFIQDCKEKKDMARSARHTRTNNGKSGAVKFPSDYLTKKELRKMNGEVVNYRFNDPMSWNEFKNMPDDIKKMYINGLREKFNVPNKEIADMLGVCQATFSKHLKFWELGGNKADGASRKKWDKEGWLAWMHGIPSNAFDNTEAQEQASSESETKKRISLPRPAA